MGRLWKKLAALLLAGVLTGCSAPAEEMQQPVERSLFAMNTYMTFTAYGEDAQAALQEAEECIQQVEGLWSVTDKDSEIYQANHSGGQPVTVSEETAEIISFALEMAQRTGGALDPTIYPVLTAWGFTTDSKQVPSQQQIAQLLEQVGYDRIQLNGSELTVPDGMELDLGAVGKGYTADLVTEILRRHGVTSALISLGGNIQAIGSRPDGSDWRLGIRAPWESGNLWRAHRQRRGGGDLGAGMKTTLRTGRAISTGTSSTRPPATRRTADCSRSPSSAEKERCATRSPPRCL